MEAWMEGGERVEEGNNPDYNSKPWIKMTIKELTTFTPGRVCKTPSWWAVTDDDCVLFFRTYGSPQCNVDRRIVEQIRPGARIMFIAQAFVPRVD